MSSMNEGLGFEELGGPGDTGSKPLAQLWITGSITTQSDMNVAGDISGAGNAQFGASVKGTAFEATSYANSEGNLQSVSIQNATELFGYKVKAGSVALGNYGSGLVSFASAGSFSTANYFMTCSNAAYAVPQFNVDGSQSSPGLSGIKRASGCWIVGGSTTVVDWIAVGI